MERLDYMTLTRVMARVCKIFKAPLKGCIPLAKAPGSNYSIMLANGEEYIISVDRSDSLNAELLNSSDEATTEFVRRHTRIPVPRVVYERDPKIAGARFLAKEIVKPAVTLYEAWPTMHTLERRKVVASIADIWGDLLGLNLPGIGRITHYSDGKPTIGPIHFLEDGVGYGPFPTTRDWLLCLAGKERYPGTANIVWNDNQRKQIDDAMNMLRQEAPVLDGENNPLVDALGAYVVYHPKFDAHTIAVDPECPTKIMAVTAFRHAVVLPLFLVINTLPSLKLPISNPKELDMYFTLFKTQLKDRVPVWILRNSSLVAEQFAELYGLAKNSPHWRELGLTLELNS